MTIKLFNFVLIWLTIFAFSSSEAFALNFDVQNSVVQTRAKGNRPANRKRRAKIVKSPTIPASSIGVGFVTTPPETVVEMLRLANLKKGDVLYDLGSGDGRIVIAAAKNYGVRAVGVEYDPKLIEESKKNAKAAGVESLVTFIQGDFYQVDLRRANVVTLYLSDKINLRLRPKLLRELPTGARIVSHDFRMGDWQPEQRVRVPWLNLYRTVLVWTVPKNRRISKIKA